MVLPFRNADPSLIPQPERTSLLSETELAVLRRHAGRGPRYTSYPPATAWNESITAADHTAALQALGRRDTPPPLSVYVHMPFCPSQCWFCACNVLITPRTDLADAYLDRVEQELALLGPHLPQDAPTVQVHWGGGSPTYLTPVQMRRLMGLLRRHFSLAADAELAIEADPRITSDEQLDTLRDLGFSRLSLGVQDFDPAVQQAIHREQGAEMTADFVAKARARGFQSVNLDLIYGLPRQTTTSFARTLDEVCELKPDRLAVYGYAHVPWLKPAQRKIDPASIPGPERRFVLLREALDVFLQEGYEYIGMDHFALPDDELARARRDGTLHRNFMGYSTRAGAELVGIGLTSISFVDGVYAQNERKLNPYYRMLDEGQVPVTRGYRLTAEDHLRADVIQDLMCKSAVDKAAIGARHGIDFDTHFAKELEALLPLEADGLVRSESGRIELSFLGRLLVRPVAMVFDDWLGREAASDAPRYSAV